LTDLSAPKKAGSRLGRFVRTALGALGIGVVFVGGTVAGAVAHLDHPAARRFLVKTIDDVLRSQFQGHLVIDKIDRLVLRRGLIQGVDLHLDDAEGHRVVTARGVRVAFSPTTLVRSLLGAGAIKLAISELHIDFADVVLREDASGAPSVAGAFASKEPSPPPDPTKPSKGFALTVDGLVLEHLWAHGRLSGQTIDADLQHLGATLALDDAALRAKLSPVQIHARALPIPAREATLGLSSEISAPLNDKGKLLVKADLTGKVAQLALAAQATLDGDALVAHVEVPRFPKEALGAVVSGVTLGAPASVRLDAKGTLTDLDVQGVVGLGEGEVDLTARIQPRATLGVTANAKIRGISLQDAAPDAPVGKVDGELTASLAMAGQAIAADYTLTTTPTTIAAQPVPAVKVVGTFDGVTLAGTVDADEPGAPAHVVYALAPEAHEPSVTGLDVHVTAQAKSLARVPRLQSAGVAGAATVDATAHLSLGKTVTVRGDAKVRASSLVAGAASVGAVQVTAHVDGPIAAPVVHGVVGATSVRAGGLILDRTSVRVDGPVLSPHVGVSTVTSEGDTAQAAFALSLASGVAVRGFAATLGRNGEELHVRVAALSVQGSSVRVDGVQIEGTAGQVTASGMFGGGALRAKVNARKLDLAVVSRVVGDQLPPLAGIIDLSADVDFPGGGRRAKAAVQLAAKGVQGPFLDAGGNGLDANLMAKVDGRAVSLTSKIALDRVGTIEASTADGHLGGNGDPLSPRSFERATGSLHTRAEVDLAGALTLIPTFFRPVEELSGVLTTEATVSRTAEHGRPDAQVKVSTRGFAVRTRSVAADGDPGPRYAGIDVAVNALYEGAHDDVSLGVGAADRHGELARVALRTRPPVEALLAGADDLRARLLDTPFFLRVTAPKRDLGDLPLLDAGADANGGTGVLGDVVGTAAVEAEVVGTLRSPDARAKVAVLGFSGSGKRAQEDPLDLTVISSFARNEGKLDANLTLGGRAVMEAKLGGKLDLAAVLEPLTAPEAPPGKSSDPLPEPPAPKWSAGGDVHFFTMPLRPVTRLAGVPVSGCLTGVVSLQNFHENAAASVDLRVDGLRVRGVSFREARLTGKVDKGLANVDATLLQEDGDLRLHADGGLAWGAALAPTPDFQQPAQAELTAKSFRLSPFQPLLDDTLAKLDGRLSADIRYRQPDKDPHSGKLSGQVSLREGVVDAVLIGQEFRDLQADVSLSEEGTVRLSNASFRGSAGRVALDATAHLRGLSLQDATAKLTIAKKEALPVTFQGVEYGSAWGDIQVTAKPGRKGAAGDAGLLALNVSVPRMDIELPDTAAKSAQSLDAAPTIDIGTRVQSAEGGRVVFSDLPLGKPKKQEKEAEPPPAVDPTMREHAAIAGAAPVAPKAPPAGDGGVVVTIALGPDIRIHKSNTIDLWLKGDLEASTAKDTVAVSGLIQTDRGFVEVQGRRFSVERATVSFDPDRPPSDPTISATALYVAPDSTRIFADFIGTVSTGSLRLRSEPVLTQPEILSLVVFGQRDGVGGGRGQSQSGANAAAGIGGGFVTQGLNKALSNVSPVEVTTRIDTTSSQNPRPEVGVAITKDVSAAVSYRIGLPTPGQAPDRSLLKLDYRFLPRWAIETTLGDRGTSIVDLTWKYRYLSRRAALFDRPTERRERGLAQPHGGTPERGGLDQRALQTLFLSPLRDHLGELRAEEKDLGRVIDPGQKGREAAGCSERRSERALREVDADEHGAEEEQKCGQERADGDVSDAELHPGQDPQGAGEQCCQCQDTQDDRERADEEVRGGAPLRQDVGEARQRRGRNHRDDQEGATEEHHREGDRPLAQQREDGARAWLLHVEDRVEAARELREEACRRDEDHDRADEGGDDRAAFGGSVIEQQSDGRFPLWPHREPRLFEHLRPHGAFPQERPQRADEEHQGGRRGKRGVVRERRAERRDVVAVPLFVRLPHDGPDGVRPARVVLSRCARRRRLAFDVRFDRCFRGRARRGCAPLHVQSRRWKPSRREIASTMASGLTRSFPQATSIDRASIGSKRSPRSTRRDRLRVKCQASSFCARAVFTARMIVWSISAGTPEMSASSSCITKASAWPFLRSWISGRTITCRVSSEMCVAIPIKLHVSLAGQATRSPTPSTMVMSVAGPSHSVRTLSSSSSDRETGRNSASILTKSSRVSTASSHMSGRLQGSCPRRPCKSQQNSAAIPARARLDGRGGAD
jgi:translocation and assembly module TamB